MVVRVDLMLIGRRRREMVAGPGGLVPGDRDDAVPLGYRATGQRYRGGVPGQVPEKRRAATAVIARPPPQHVGVLSGERSGLRPVGDDAALVAASGFIRPLHAVGEA